MIDIEDMRNRHANSIRNTATGRALGAALDELDELRENQRPETTAEITERIELALTAEIMERIALAIGLTTTNEGTQNDGRERISQ
ncbi:MAG: hypothetical protein GY903_00950 [Fuerstiella sp.]|nr:hypothetical protein [Fuerstiella sp.]